MPKNGWCKSPIKFQNAPSLSAKDFCISDIIVMPVIQL